MKPTDKQAIEHDEQEREEKSEPVGTTEPIPGYGQAPEGVRTLRLPDVAPRREVEADDDDSDA
jgi:hypothetical protein